MLTRKYLWKTHFLVFACCVLPFPAAMAQLGNQAQQQFKSRSDDLTQQNNLTKAQMQANANAKRAALLSKTVTVLREQNTKLREESERLKKVLESKQAQLMQIKAAVGDLEKQAADLLGDNAKPEGPKMYLEWAVVHFQSKIRPLLDSIKPYPATENSKTASEPSGEPTDVPRNAGESDSVTKPESTPEPSASDRKGKDETEGAVGK